MYTTLYTLLKFAHFLGLSLLLGGPIFWSIIWYPATRSVPLLKESVPITWDRVRRGILWGAVLFALSGLGDALRAASQVISLSNVEMLGFYFSQILYGQMSLLKAVVAPLFAVVALKRGRVTSSTSTELTNHSTTLLHPGRRTVLAFLGSVLIAAISLTSHAAAREGLAPVVVDGVHQLAAVFWGGAILYFAMVPWRRLADVGSAVLDAVSRALNRFSGMALVAVLVVSATGYVSSFFHVYDTASLINTPYGRTLSLKVALVIVILGAACINLLVLAPRSRTLAGELSESARDSHREVSGRQETIGLLRSLRTTIGIEALLIVGVLAAAANLTTLPPADTPGYVADIIREGETGPYDVRLEMASSGITGQVEISVFVTDDGAPPPPGTGVDVHLVMLEHDMGTNRLEARPISQTLFATDGLISMAGFWEARVFITHRSGESYQLQLPFEAASGVLDQGRVRRLDFSLAWSSLELRISFVLGLILIVLAGVGILGAQTGRMASWAAPFSFIVALLGSAQILGLTLVDAYPTTYWTNPTAYTAEVVTEGRGLYLDNCAVCHGETGRGDGPAAAALNPQPADLAAEHVDDHTDGDIFWWLTHGIPGTAMPGWDGQLTEEERWILVQYVRSIRHGVPIEVLQGSER